MPTTLGMAESGSGADVLSLRLMADAARSGHHHYHRRLGVHCEVCLEMQYHVEAVRECASCLAILCVPCYTSWLSSRIASGAPRHSALTCISCPRPISAADVHALCSEATYRKYIYFMERRLHAANPYALWCPASDCRRLLRSSPSSLGELSEALTCGECGTEACGYCGELAHITGQACAVPRREPMKHFRAALWTVVHAKKCPECSCEIVRDGGCTRMRCVCCNVSFCWRCRGVFLDDGTSNGTRGRKRSCVCEKVHNAAVWSVMAAGAVVALPLVAGACLIAGAPFGLYYASVGRGKREEIKRNVEGVRRFFEY